jgi:hypothetical protein
LILFLLLSFPADGWVCCVIPHRFFDIDSHRYDSHLCSTIISHHLLIPTFPNISPSIPPSSFPHAPRIVPPYIRLPSPPTLMSSFTSAFVISPTHPHSILLSPSHRPTYTYSPNTVTGHWSLSRDHNIQINRFLLILWETP